MKINSIPSKYRHDFTTKGFTLIETLIAVAVLMIAIAGPLSISSKALTTSLYARDQTTASYLAQEEMELIKNYKDNNIMNSPPWTNGIDSCIGTTGSYCDLSPTGHVMTTCPASGSPGCALNVSDNGTYTNDGTKGATGFSRNFRLLKIQNSATPPNSDPNEYQAIITVFWNTGSVVNTVVLRSQITSAAEQ